jgi:hypothetical protein
LVLEREVKMMWGFALAKRLLVFKILLLSLSAEKNWNFGINIVDNLVLSL